jgi:hypothetical protein
LVALEKLAIEREGDGRDEDGANAERQEGNFHSILMVGLYWW